MLKLNVFVLLTFTALSASAEIVTSAAATNSATAAKYTAGCGFDYDCDSNGNIIRNVPTAPKAVSSPNVVDLGGGSHTVGIIDKKNKDMPSLKQKEMPKFPEKPERTYGGIDYAPQKTKPESVLHKTSPNRQTAEKVQVKSEEPVKKQVPKPESVKETPKVPASDKRTGYGIDYAEPKTKPVSVLPKMPSVQSEQAQVKSEEKSLMPPYQPWLAKEKPVENKDQPKSEAKPATPQTRPVPAVIKDTQAVDPNLPTGPSIRTKEVPLPGQESLNADKEMAQPLKQPAMDRAAGAHEIFELHEGNEIKKSKPLNERAGRWTKPLKEDDWKTPEKQDQSVAEEKAEVQQQKADKPKATKKKPQKQKEPEQKTVIKKMDPNKKWGEFKPIYEPSESAKKIKKLDPNKWKFKHEEPSNSIRNRNMQQEQQKARDPFAKDKELDSKYERNPSSANGNRSGRRGMASYGDDSNIALQKQAAANKQARLAREQAEREAEAAAMAGMMTNTMMNATLNHIDAKNARRNEGSSGGVSSEPTVYRSRGYADTVYSREGDSYSAPNPNNSATYNKAKSMIGGSGW